MSNNRVERILLIFFGFVFVFMSSMTLFVSCETKADNAKFTTNLSVEQHIDMQETKAYHIEVSKPK
ncbi:MAG: hypothetical protein AAF806_28775 [Bacteroidota bacterium]